MLYAVFSQKNRVTARSAYTEVRVHRGKGVCTFLESGQPEKNRIPDRTFPFSCFMLSNSLCCSLILANNSCSLRRISAWSRRFSSSRSRMDFCCCKNVLFPVAEEPVAVSLLFTRSFSSGPSGDRPGDRLGERLVRLPGLRPFLKNVIKLRYKTYN